MLNRIVRNTIRSVVIQPLRGIAGTVDVASVRALKFSEYGEPGQVIHAIEETVNGVKPTECLIKIIAAPINPADINTIQGVYPVKPSLPAVPGNECVAEVLAVGQDVKDLAVGDHVVPFNNGLGTWRSHAIINSQEIMKVPKELGIVEASTILVNPPTAYRMLKDFVQLSPGDTVIQNGANSAVGQAVIQMCKKWGLNCIGVVRNRPEINRLCDFLLELGAAEILTEEQVRTTDIFKNKKFPKPKLALNCVGGKSATEIMRQLGQGGAMVTYGGMSREPVTIPTSALIFKDVRFYGFWMTRWHDKFAQTPERTKMFNDIIQMCMCGELKPPIHKFVPFDEYKQALDVAMNIKGYGGEKLIFDFRQGEVCQ